MSCSNPTPSNPTEAVGSPRTLAIHVLPNFGRTTSSFLLTTMNISPPEALKTFVDEQVEGRGYSASSEYVRELIRRDQDRLHLRGLLLDGASSASTAPADPAYFDGLRRRARGPTAG